MKIKKYSKVLIISIVIFLIIEAAFAYCFATVCNYNYCKVSVDDTDEIMLEMRTANVGRHTPTSLRIDIHTSESSYYMIWRATYVKSTGMNVVDAVQALKTEKFIFIRTKGSNSICALNGESRSYFDIAEYNAWHKSNCNSAILIWSIFQLAVLASFGVLFRVLWTLRSL